MRQEIEPTVYGAGASSEVRKAGDQAGTPEASLAEKPRNGMLIVNADDWGVDPETTNSIERCVRAGAVSSVSAMVFMRDSERAAAIARETGIDAGLHLNLTTRFSAPDCPSRLAEHQASLAACLRKHAYARVVFHPRLAQSFEYVVKAQIEEFHSLYGAEVRRLDGHHHMHLCSNLLFSSLLPSGIVVRRNFSFQPGEKGAINRLYRKAVDCMLSRRYRLVDFLFNLLPLKPSTRMDRIVSLAQHFAVELETHPANPEEYRFLTGSKAWLSRHDARISPHFDVSPWGTRSNYFSKSGN